MKHRIGQKIRNLVFSILLVLALLLALQLMTTNFQMAQTVNAASPAEVAANCSPSWSVGEGIDLYIPCPLFSSLAGENEIAVMFNCAPRWPIGEGLDVIIPCAQ